MIQPHITIFNISNPIFVFFFFLPSIVLKNVSLHMWEDVVTKKKKLIYHGQHPKNDKLTIKKFHYCSYKLQTFH